MPIKEGAALQFSEDYNLDEIIGTLFFLKIPSIFSSRYFVKVISNLSSAKLSVLGVSNSSINSSFSSAIKIISSAGDSSR